MSLLPSGAIETGGYNINNSLRFRSSASAYLSRTATTPTNNLKWTWSGWVKRGALGTLQGIFDGYSNSSNWTSLFFNSDNTLYFYNVVSGVDWDFTTTAVFRDPSAWYHIVLVYDSANATAANRVIIYVNNVSQSGSSPSGQTPQNQTSYINAANAQALGRRTDGSYYSDCYMTEVNFIDGQALTPSSFGETDAVTGSWVAKKYTGTYGTNGFYLPFNKNSLGFSSYYGNFNGSNQSLSVANNTALNPGTNDYCVEAFMYSTSLNVTALFDFGGNSGSIQLYFESGRATFRSNGSDIIDVPFNAPNQWVHIAVTRSGSSVRLFVNGIQQGSTVSNSDNLTSTQVKYIGRLNGGYYFNGRISNFRFVKGSAVYTSNFTVPTSALTAITNTQLLTLQNSTIIDNSTNAFSITNNNSVTTTSAIVGDVALITSDQSGNNNNWNPNNINYSTVGTTYDSMTDVPTLTSATVANFPVLNPLSNGGATISNANLTVTANGATHYVTNSTFQIPTSGKWYWETTASTLGSTARLSTGILPNGTALSGFPYTSSNTYGWYYGDASNNLYWKNNGSDLFNITGAVNDVLQICYDADNGTVYAGKNNVFYNSSGGTTGSPSTLTNPTSTGASSTNAYFPATTVFTAGVLNINFGQRPFSYTPPTGFVALNTYNLPTPTILQGNKYMDATLYTGTSANQTIVNAGQFKPDFLWIKTRSGASTYNHHLVDSVRGNTYLLRSNSTGAEQGPTTDQITSFNSNGFSLGADTAGPADNEVNQSPNPIVAWQWQAGQGSTSSNTSGSITSTVSVNTTAGFSVVTYTGTGSNATVGHGLGVAPKMIIVKGRSIAESWRVGHNSVNGGSSPWNYYMALNLTNAAAAASTVWNNTAPTSSVFSIGTDSAMNSNTNTYVAYCWAEIAGFSKFGSYTGNGSTDGPFVYTGFRPKYVMIKRTDSADDWIVMDSARNTYNVANSTLFPNGSYAETTDANRQEDFLSNGFKVRSSPVYINASGGTYIYAAFAENPFKNANAR